MIYSIGHGRKKIEAFISELQSFSISYLMDVRSVPFSRWNPQFNRENLKKVLEENKIIYLFAGDKLGGRPRDKSCYGNDGQIDYDLLREKDYFKEGLKRIITANEKKISLAILCSETNPDECHRSKLIGKELLSHSIILKHITGTGTFRQQEQHLH